MFFSYNLQMEDDGNYGNDETRLFILSSLAQHQKSRVTCVLCLEPMLVFDRYPLVDGTFFLSPKQHTKDCIEVSVNVEVNLTFSLIFLCFFGNTLLNLYEFIILNLYKQVEHDGQAQFLTAVCMGCLEGVSPDRVIRCR